MTYPTNQIPSVNPQNITVSNPVGCEHNPRDPNAQDNTFPPGWEWQNTISGNFFKCQSSTIAGAVWIPFAGAGAGTVVELTGNSGGPVGPDGGGNINVVGDSTTITIAGNPGTNTLTASLVGGGVASQSYVTNVSGPVSPTAAGVIDLNASTSTYTDGGTANTIKTELQGTNHALFVGKGVHTPASTIGTGTSGQALVSGGAGSDPAFGTLGVSGGGTGDTSFTAYAPISGGTTATGALQSAATGLATPGFVFTSNGNAALPSFQSIFAASGIFAPTLSFGGASTGITYILNTGEYWQIGSVVFFNFQINLSNKGSSTGNSLVTLTGLPNAVNTIGTANVALFVSVTLNAGYTQVILGVQPNTNTATIEQLGSGALQANLTDGNFANNSSIAGSGLYFTT